MKCPTVDKLSEYVDELVTEQEFDELYKHVKQCDQCRRVVEAFIDEQQFLKESLQTPTLPNDFTSLVLNQLEPYEQKSNRRNKAPWKRILLTAAGIVLAVSLSATLNPSFAQWIGGMFSTEQVDEGLRMAADAGLAERVDYEVTDNGLTFKVEDVVADSSRVALSYQILNKKGKPQDAHLDLGWTDADNKIMIVDQNGTLFDGGGMGWREDSDYGLIEFSLREQETTGKLTVKFDLVELDGVKGNWQLEIPIDLTKSRELTSVIPLTHAETSSHGVTVQMKEIKFAPSSNELVYETGFTVEEEVRVETEIQELEARLGKDSIRPNNSSSQYGTAIRYHIENENRNTIFNQDYNTFFAEEPQPGDLQRYQRTGLDMEQLGQVAWHESFIPQKGDRKLTFVLDGVYKTVPSDFSVTIKPKELKRNPVLFDYEGNFITIKKASKKGEYHLRKSIFPIRKETTFAIEMEGGIEKFASDLGNWVLTDDKGKSYPTYGGGSKLKKKDDNGRYKTTINLTVYGLHEIPEELTLHLVSVTRYEEVKDRWEVPLYK